MASYICIYSALRLNREISDLAWLCRRAAKPCCFVMCIWAVQCLAAPQTKILLTNSLMLPLCRVVWNAFLQAVPASWCCCQLSSASAARLLQNKHKLLCPPLCAALQERMKKHQNALMPLLVAVWYFEGSSVCQQGQHMEKAQEKASVRPLRCHCHRCSHFDFIPTPALLTLWVHTPLNLIHTQGQTGPGSALQTHQELFHFSICSVPVV